MPDPSRTRPRFWWAGLLVAASFSLMLPCAGHAAEMEVLAGRQTGPGVVEVTVKLNSALPAPRAGNWVMRLDGPVDVEASQLRMLPPDPPPAWLVLCLDRSGSLSDVAVAEIRQALSSSLRRDEQGNMPYQIALISFATDIRQGPRFSGRYADVEAALGDFVRERNPHGRSRLYDATLSALANLRGRDGGKRLILVSDGKDEGSVQGVEQLKRRTRADGDAVPIDTVAYGTQSQAFGGALSEVAGDTGGRFDSASSPGELGVALKRMLSDASRVQSRYLLSFQYKADTARTSAVSRIVYTPTGGAPVVETLTAPVSAAAAVPPPPPLDNWFKLLLDWFDRVIEFFGELPALVKAISGLLAALTALFAAQKTIKVIHERAPQIRDWIVIHLTGHGTQPRTETTVTPPTTNNPRPSRRATMVNGYAWPDPAPDRPAAILRGVEGTARGRTLKISKPVFTIGAGDDNDLVLIGDEWASAHHARLRVQSGSLYLEDLDSTNGSFHNQTKFQNDTKGLAPGDTVRFGHSSFEVLNPLGQAA